MTTCPGCGCPVDTLRAGHVAVLDGRFRYFCRADCKQAYLREQGRPADEDVATSRPPEVAESEAHDLTSLPPASEEGVAIVASRARGHAVPVLELAGIVLGALVPAMGLLAPLAEVARLPLALASCVALVLRVSFAPREPADPHPLVILVPPIGAATAACWAHVVHDTREAPIAVLAGLSCAVAIAAEALTARARARVVAARERVEQALEPSARGPARIDVGAPTPRALRFGVERGAPIAALVTGLAALAAGASPVQVLAATCAGAIAFAAKGAASFAALHYARAHLTALRRGVTYKDARAFERAGAVDVAVLSARGTVLLGEPEIVAIEPVGAFEVERMLALAAGAEIVSTHPFAAAIQRAARARGVEPDAVRNPTVHAGLGVTASSSSGERLVVGGRAMMLEQKVGVAAADVRVSELEAQGRSVLLVALDDRLVGLIALADGLRPGARAAVQALLDARIEPVLLSGEARETCETIGRALDVDHVRPEVLPAERGAAVRSLAEGGSVVAVVGHPARDDGALAAADVAVAMAAGSTSGDWAVALAGDDVRDAAAALQLAHEARRRAGVAVVLGASPGVVALLALIFGIGPLAIAPLGALVGALAVAVHARQAAAAD